LWSWDTLRRRATCRPAAPLLENTRYVVRVATTAEDKQGNLLATAHTFSFTTGVSNDTSAPQISTTVPAANQTGIARTAKITVYFSEAMDQNSAEAAFRVISPSELAEGTFSWNNGLNIM